ncbi:unnamed protein product [Acanthosepion pharaonis]|uniref:Uncharacterized protein n=1 Tax=Acanthosepion pharaonis TaxID=158019 RepID=A0A812CUP0_ACAPH|nr:unnamed protein product [Sepia pharaonis]
MGGVGKGCCQVLTDTHICTYICTHNHTFSSPSFLSLFFCFHLSTCLLPPFFPLFTYFPFLPSFLPSFLFFFFIFLLPFQYPSYPSILPSPFSPSSPLTFLHRLSYSSHPLPIFHDYFLPSCLFISHLPFQSPSFHSFSLHLSFLLPFLQNSSLTSPSIFYG